MKNLLFILSIFLLSSCNKERTLHIKAINAVTGDPYSGLSYSVVEEKTGMNGEEFTTVESGTLNSSGEAFPSVKIKKNRSYSIYVSEPENTCYNKKMNYSYAIQDDENPTFLFEFAECAFLKLSINNINCQGPLDNFKLYHEGSDAGFISEISGTPIKQGDGCYSYIGSSFSDVPMGKRWYRWEVTRNSITNTYYDTINLAPEEYRTFEINY